MSALSFMDFSQLPAHQQLQQYQLLQSQLLAIVPPSFDYLAPLPSLPTAYSNDTSAMSSSSSSTSSSQPANAFAAPPQFFIPPPGHIIGNSHLLSPSSLHPSFNAQYLNVEPRQSHVAVLDPREGSGKILDPPTPTMIPSTPCVTKNSRLLDSSRGAS